MGHRSLNGKKNVGFTIGWDSNLPPFIKCVYFYTSKIATRSIYHDRYSNYKIVVFFGNKLPTRFLCGVVLLIWRRLYHPVNNNYSICKSVKLIAWKVMLLIQEKYRACYYTKSIGRAVTSSKVMNKRHFVAKNVCFSNLSFISFHPLNSLSKTVQVIMNLSN